MCVVTRTCACWCGVGAHAQRTRARRRVHRCGPGQWHARASRRYYRCCCLALLLLLLLLLLLQLLVLLLLVWRPAGMMPVPAYGEFSWNRKLPLPTKGPGHVMQLPPTWARARRLLKLKF